MKEAVLSALSDVQDGAVLAPELGIEGWRSKIE
jgi:hypothetical protein